MPRCLSAARAFPGGLERFGPRDAQGTDPGRAEGPAAGQERDQLVVRWTLDTRVEYGEGIPIARPHAATSTVEVERWWRRSRPRLQPTPSAAAGLVRIDRIGRDDLRRS